MAVEYTTFKVFNSVHQSNNIGSTPLSYIQAVASGDISSITLGGIGPPQELTVDYSADQFDIPEGSTIVGFRTRIQADGNLNQTDVNVEYTFADSYDSTHDAAGFGGPVNTRVINSDSSAVYIDGYDMDSDNNYLNDDVLNVWNTHGLARLRIRFLSSDPDEDDGFMAVRFDSDSIGLQIAYEAPTPTKVTLKPSGPYSVTKGASTATGDGASALNANQLTTSADGTSMATFNAPTHTQFSHFDLTDFGFNIPSDAIIDSVQLDINVDREPFAGNQAFQLAYGFSRPSIPYTFMRHSIVYPFNQNHYTDSNLYINSENNNYFTPAVINNLNLRINWPVGSIDTFFTDTITGELPSGTPSSQTSRNVYIGGIPGTDGGSSPSSGFYPKITVNYFLPSKVKFQPSTVFTGVATNTQGPLSHDALGDVGDGLTYSTPATSARQRVMRNATGINNVCVISPAAGNSPIGFKMFNFFGEDSFLIPPDAVIEGVELIAGTDFDGTGESYIGSFGGNINEQFDVECRFYNGVNYSNRLVWDTSGVYTGVTFSSVGGGTNNRATFSGGNRRYKNNTDGDDVLFGGPNNLSGLDWDPANQANFGVGFAGLNGVGSSPAGGIVRGIRMKLYYKIPLSVENKVKIQQSLSF